MFKGTKEGNDEEIDFVKNYNKGGHKQVDKLLGIKRDNVYAIRVTQKKFGKINGNKILCKADVFLAKGSINKEYLEALNYYLDESVSDFEFKPIPFTGISVKRKDSRIYTIMKISPPTFKKVFGSNVLAAGASLYCRKEDEFYKNKHVLNGWGVTTNEIIKYFSPLISGQNDLIDKEKLGLIKKLSNQEIHNTILNNKKIRDLCFQGKGNFQEPYTASLIFKNNQITKNIVEQFVITTGSGRSRGDFTIVLKPKTS